MRLPLLGYILALCAGCSAATAPKPLHPNEKAALPADVVARASTPYYGIRRSDGERLDAHELLEALSRADAVCIGEHHDDPAHHFAQLEILRRLALRAPQSGRKLAVGFEMFSRITQSALDDYAVGRIDEEALLERTEWESRWGFDFALYRPLVELGRRSSSQLLALNAPRELTRAVSRRGLDGLTADQRRQLPKLDLADANHRRFFDQAMAGHPMNGTDHDHMYAAQVLWDETMAATAAEWLARGTSARQVAIIAGVGHCHESAIVRRVERRVAVNVIAVRPIAESELEERSTSTAEPLFDYDFVLAPSRGG